MKKMKRFFALFLAMAMVLGMSMTTFAAQSVAAKGTEADKGTITVKGIESDNATVTAYPIAMAEYNNNGSFSGYSNLYNITLEAPTREQLDAIDVTVLTGIKLDPGINGTYSKADQAVGMYLIVVTPFDGATNYSRAVASIQYVNEDGSNAIESGTVTMATSVQSPATWVKKTTDVEVEKTAKVGEADAKTAKVGDTIDYTVKIDPVPRYSGSYPKLNVEDKLSDGLTYNNDLVVKAGETELVKGTHYTAEYKEGVLTVNFVVNGENGVNGQYMLNEYAGTVVTLTYSAELNTKAVLNDGNGNTNDVKLSYTKDSTVDGDDSEDNDKVHTYTFEIGGEATSTTGIITKVGTDEDENGLDGAEFTIYREDPTDNANAEIYTNKSGTISNEGVVTTKTVAGKKGQLHISGLAEGTYYIRETKAPEEYSVNAHVFVVKIEALWDTADGKICTGAKITVDGNDVATINSNHTGEYTGMEIENTKLSSLPSTGGIGTTIFTVGGCAIMILAAGMFFVSRRKAAR